MVAPADRVLSLFWRGGYVEWSGTSMAAPHVSGAVALLYAALERDGRWPSPYEVERRLYDTAVKIQARPDYDPSFDGYGRIDIGAAIRSDMPTPEKPTPDGSTPDANFPPTSTPGPTPTVDLIGTEVAKALTATAAASTATITPATGVTPTLTATPMRTGTLTATPCSDPLCRARGTATARAIPTLTRQAVETAVRGTLAAPTATPTLTDPEALQTVEAEATLIYVRQWRYLPAVFSQRLPTPTPSSTPDATKAARLATVDAQLTERAALFTQTAEAGPSSTPSAAEIRLDWSHR